MSHTIADILARTCANYQVDVSDAVQISLVPGVSAHYRIPPQVVRRDIFITISPSAGPVTPSEIEVIGVLETEQGLDGNARLAISLPAFKALYGIATDDEAYRRAFYVLAEHLQDLTASINATTGKHLVIGVGLVPNT